MKGLPFSLCVFYVHVHYSLRDRPTQSHSRGATYTNTHTQITKHTQFTGAVCSSASFSSCLSFIFRTVNESKANRRRRRRRRRGGWKKRGRRKSAKPYVTEPGRTDKEKEMQKKSKKIRGGYRSLTQKAD